MGMTKTQKELGTDKHTSGTLIKTPEKCTIVIQTHADTYTHRKAFIKTCCPPRNLLNTPSFL